MLECTPILIEGANRAMDFYLRRLQNAIGSVTAGMTPEMLARRPQPEKWSTAEVLEHLYLTFPAPSRDLRIAWLRASHWPEP